MEPTEVSSGVTDGAGLDDASAGIGPAEDKRKGQE